MKRQGTGKKAYVGLSGGVDSSVSAALLKKAGYDVTGVFIKVWQPDWITCTWKDDRLDAMRVCAKLGIPFVTLDLEKEYKREVVDYMINEYKAGRTPNPDVMCNQHVKFGAFYNWAMEKGADFVATGHYAQIHNQQLTISNQQGPSLMKAKDANKDQTYFLWTLKSEQLEHVLFPIGHLLKPEVRKLAEKFDLITADKKDSQGICFIGKIDMKDFLKEFIESEPGTVMNEAGEAIGTHDGALFYTLGERHGFTITKKSPNEEPYYVVARDLGNNTITVSHKKTDGTLISATKEARLNNTNWTVQPTQKKYEARTRYRQELQKCTIELGDDGTVVVHFDEPQNSISSGQSFVAYDGDICIGGGILS